MGRPTPFSRPSISVSDSKPRRWLDVPVHALSEGDNVRGHGVISRISVDEDEYHIIWQNGTTSMWDAHDEVTAFTEA